MNRPGFGGMVANGELESHPNFSKYKHLLSPGWIPGRMVDNSDQQYASFRNNIPVLFSLLALHFVLRRIFNFVYSRAFPAPPQNSSYRPNHNLTRRKLFDILFALIFLTGLHSLSVIKILVILLLNFSISYFHPSSRLVPLFTWVFNIGVLFANEYFKGYRFREILPFLIAGEGEGVGYWMDHFMGGGILSRWEVSFNITVLRLISYNMDHYWAAVRRDEGAEREAGSVIEVGRLATAQHHSAAEGEGEGGERTDPERANGENDDEAVDDSGDEERLMLNAELKKKHADPAHVDERDRIETPARPEDYSLLNYLAYILYTPLYLAGPILTFNDFIHQVCYLFADTMVPAANWTHYSKNTRLRRLPSGAASSTPCASPSPSSVWKWSFTTSTSSRSPRLHPAAAGQTTPRRSSP